ncbi:MAG: GrpB family protein [Acidimicrobiia bacterium]
MARKPLTSEELEAATVGPLESFSGRIRLVEYDREWPRLYDEEEARVRTVLEGRVIRLEHVGSTSVPGLAAKPIIDIVLAVADSSDEGSYVPNLQSASYSLRVREPDWFQHRLFKGPVADVNLHVFSEGSTEIDRMILFRDWLRAHEDDRLEYERVKRELATREWGHVQHYADAKNEIVDEILDRAWSGRS